MITRLTYVPDTIAFMAEVEALYPEYLTKDEDGNITGVSIVHTPLKKNENGSLGYSIMKDGMLEAIEVMTTVVNLGDYAEMFADEVKHDKYKSVYPYHIPLIYVDENDVEQTYTLPKKIGVFA